MASSCRPPTPQQLTLRCDTSPTIPLLADLLLTPSGSNVSCINTETQAGDLTLAVEANSRVKYTETLIEREREISPRQIDLRKLKGRGDVVN